MTARATAPRQRRPAGRNIELGKIHIGATAVGLIRNKGSDKDDYYAMLWTVGRVKSAAELDDSGRRRVLEHLRARGWVDPGEQAYQQRMGRRRPVNPQAAKIRSLWHALADAGQLTSTSEVSLRAYVQHQSASYDPAKHGYSAPELLPPTVAQRVIEHLKQWCRRTGTEI